MNLGIILVVKVVWVASEKLAVILVNSSEVSERLAKGFGGSAATAATCATGAATAATAAATAFTPFTGDTAFAFARTGETDFALSVAGEEEGDLYNGVEILTGECRAFDGISVICRPRLFEENDIYCN